MGGGRERKRDRPRSTLSDGSESINAGVVKRERKVKAGRLREALEGGQVHYGWGEEFTPETSRGAGDRLLRWSVSEKNDGHLV